MSVQVKRRREAASFLSTFTGAQGELIVDTTNNRVQVHDGVTPGGWPAARLSEVITNTRTAVADANYAAQTSDRLIAYTALTATRTVTLPAASAFPTGTPLLVVDESGACSPTITITMLAVGSDMIDSATSAIISAAYGYLALQCNGVGKWTIVNQTATSLPALIVNNGIPGNTAASLASLYVSALGQGVFPATFDSYSGSASAVAGTANLVFRQCRGTPSAPSASQSGDRIGGFGARGYGASGFASTNRVNLNFIATQNWTDAAQGCAFAIATTPNNSTSPAEAIRVDNTGYVGIGTTAPAQKLDVAGAVAVNGNIVIGADRTHYLGSFSVANLPAPGVAGRVAFATNGRMFNGSGSLEVAGAGTGGLVVDNGTAWKIAGTSQTVQA